MVGASFCNSRDQTMNLVVSAIPVFSLCTVSWLLSMGLVAWVKQRLSQRLLDIPNERSSHTQPTPRGGGLGFLFAFGIAIFVAGTFPQFFADFGLAQSLGLGWGGEASLSVSLPFVGVLFLVLTPLGLIGFLDDQGNVAARWRYLVQLGTASLAVLFLGAFPQPWLGRLGSGGPIVAIALTIIGLTAVINFYNFMDGLDGLVGGVTVVQLGFLALYLDQPFCWLLVAALLGFLRWNWAPAKIFMGDVGSTVLGATVAIALLRGSATPYLGWSALMITLPLCGDAIYTLVRRLLRRENIFQAHKTHLYQRLQQAGWSHAQVASTYIGLTVAVAIALQLLGTIGIGMSVIGIIGGIGIGEWYLHRPSQ